jgi:uncharacterized protein (DUF2267 family)
MTITIRRDVTYSILKKINNSGEGRPEVNFNNADFAEIDVKEADFLGHLDYLNQNHFINAKFTGNAYAEPEKLVDEILHPEPIKLKTAEITDKGRKLLEKLETESSKVNHQKTIPIDAKDMPFLEKVMLKAGLEDIFDARDVSEVVFRTMRDMMTKEAVEHVAEELHEPAEITTDKSLQNEIADLWKDTNPIVAFLSRVRPPLVIKSETFLFRIKQESSLQSSLNIEDVVKAVFSATKDELSEERIQEVAQFLPDKIRQLWEEA